VSASVVAPLGDAGGDRTAEVLESVRSVLVRVIGEDYLIDVPIHLETSFESDLEIESVEFVALAEALQEYYPSVDFVGWVADMEVEELMRLKVGRLVEFIVRCLG